MKKILVLFTHPKYEKSIANSLLIDQIKDKKGITVHDLYEEYPDFHIDVEREKNLLNQHDIIIWQHPFYWYSCPPLMKQWIDLVLEFGWAYGPNGNALKGKSCLNVITTGGTREVYCSQGSNSFTITEFLRPFEQTAKLCGMDYLPPFAVMGTHILKRDEIIDYAEQYGKLIDLLQEDLSVTYKDGCYYLNDIEQLNSN
tara:strand:- start:7527 stop:8123 length:597 start_codon:yes stop_codon:yes gene_type:complete